MIKFIAAAVLQAVFANAAHAQFQILRTQENIKKEGVTTDAAVDTLGVYSKETIYQYYDGFNRPVETTIGNGTPQQKDFIQPVAYDAFGGVSTNLLPYTDNSTGGWFRGGAATTSQATFYNTTSTYLVARDNSPYSSTVFESSPLRRVLQTGMAGDGFQPGVTGDKFKSVNYRSNNTTADGSIFVWVPNGTYTPGTLYGANSLWVTDGTDEDGVETMVYTDVAGHTVLKRQVHSGGNLDTYYVYNMAGMLSYVIPPAAVAQLAAHSYSLTASPINKMIFSYTYDGKGRLATKTVPSAGAVYYVYDYWNRPVLIQDGNLRNNNKWNYIKYDVKGRVVSQGIYTDATHTTQDGMQTYVDGFATSWYESRSSTLTNGGYYTNNCFPSSSVAALAYAYYDNYDIDNNGTANFSYVMQSDPVLGTDPTVTGSPLRGVPTVVSKTTIGNGITSGTWLTTVTFFDKRGNPIQVQSNNQIAYTTPTAMTDYKTIIPDFTGVPQISKVSKKGTAGAITTVYTSLSYDHMYRITGVSQKYGTGTMQQVAAYSYNELGQLTTKSLGQVAAGVIPADVTLSTTYSGTNTIVASHSITFSPGASVTSGSTFSAFISTGYLQTVDYRYNIRGQLLTINNSTLSNDMATNKTNGDTNDLFGMELLYDKQDGGLLNAARFNGKLTGVKWMSKDDAGTATKERSYKFTYDDLDRYTAETYGERVTAGSGSFTNNLNGFDEYGITYDVGGNLTHLNRKSSTVGGGTISTIDNLTYTYDTANLNQLKTVTDAGTSAGFVGGTGNYVYDANSGNLTTDPYKGLTLTYNDLNRTNVITVTAGSGQHIDYTYAVSGELIRKQAYKTGTTTVVTDYVDGFVYINGTLSYFPMPEGRVLYNAGTYTQEFVITDQQGNARLSFQNNAGTAKATQENSYYGFGMTMTSAMTLPTTPNKRLYNGGSEWQNDYANNPDYYQTFYRNYDAALGRFVAVDPKAEVTGSLSVYHYAGNNPVMMNDPNGDYQTNPFSPGFNQQVGNVWTNPNVNMGPTAGGLNPNLNYGGATGAGDNIFYYQLLAAASGGSSDAWKQYAALKGGKSIYQAYGNGKSTGVSKGSLRDYMEDIHINGIDPTGVTMLAEVTIREAGWKIQAEAYGSEYYRSANQGDGDGDGPGPKAQPKQTTTDNSSIWPHLVGPGLILSGAQIISKKFAGQFVRSFVLKGASEYTSAASLFFRNVIPSTWERLSFLPDAVTLGGQLGKFTPMLGEGLLLWDVTYNWSFKLTNAIEDATGSAHDDDWLARDGVCFRAGTLVYLKNGHFKKIEDITIGDTVYTYDTKTSQVKFSEVLNTFKYRSKSIYKLETQNTTLFVTAEHPFYVKGKGWVKVKDLKLGYKLRSLKDDYEPVISLTAIDKEEFVYNIEVDRNHDYFVSKFMLLVHNKKVKPQPLHQVKLDHQTIDNSLRDHNTKIK